MEERIHPARIFYRKYLSKYAFARKLKEVMLSAWHYKKHAGHLLHWWFCRSMHAVFSSMSGYAGVFSAASKRALECLGRNSSGSSPYYQLLTFSEYISSNQLVLGELAPRDEIILPVPAVYPESYRDRFCADPWVLAAPEVSAIEIDNAEVVGKCDFIFTQTHCLHHGMYDFKRDFPAEEMHGMIKIMAKRNATVRLTNERGQINEIPRAISMVGSASENYVHWLTETAPKLALIDGVEAFQDYPLIIDANLHPNIMESIKWLSSGCREIIPLRKGGVCKVKKLVAITPVAYIPFEYRSYNNFGNLRIDPGWAIFSPYALRALRDKLLSRIEGGRGGYSGSRIYLRRCSAHRQMQNADEVENALRQRGFCVVAPEALSFRGQVEIFANAEIIVSQAGAALGNIIFAPRGCRIVILSAWSPFSIYYYFSNLASIFEHRSSFVLCKADEREAAHPAHKGMHVDVSELIKAIEQ